MSNPEENPVAEAVGNTVAEAPGKSSSSSSSKTGSRRRAPGSGGSALGLLGVFLALIAMGMASYPLYELLVLRTAEVDTQSAQVVALQRQLTALEQQQARQAQQSQAQLAEIQRQREADAVLLVQQRESVDAAVVSLRSEMQAVVGTSSQDWLFAEVEYLLRLANQRVLMERDPESAAALLRAADDIVRNAQGLAAYELREAIAGDLVQLNSVATVDVDGLYLRLAALSTQAMNLPRRTLQFAPSETIENAADAAGNDEVSLVARAWNLLRSAGRRLASLVDYRRDGVVIAPILPPKEEYYLRQNLVLKLQLAQLALLRGDQVVYDNALREINDWVAEYFDVEVAATAAMMEAASRLQAVDIAAPLPDISGSLTQARALMARFSSANSRDPIASDQNVRDNSGEPEAAAGGTQ